MTSLAPIALEGEVLAPADTITIACRPNAMLNHRVVMTAPSGLSIGEIVHGLLSDELRGRRAHVSIEGHQIPRDRWHGVRLKPGRTLEVVGVPGNGRIWRAIGSIFVALAAAVLAPLLAAPIISGLGFAAGGIAAKAIVGIVGAGLTIAGSLAVNALFPAPKPSLSNLSGDQLDRSPTYSIGGARNQARPFEAVPILLGRHRVSPFYGAQPYTELVANDQYLRLLFVWGHGPIDVADLKIGETPLSQFEGVEIETISMQTNGEIPLFPSSVSEEQLQVDLSPALTWTTRTTAANAREIIVDVLFPGGAFLISNQTGVRSPRPTSAYAEYRLLPSGSWTPLGQAILDSVITVPTRRQMRAVVPLGQYEVRVRKNEPNYVGDQFQAQEAITWTALRTIRYERPIRSSVPLTVTAIRLKASSELSGVVDTFNGVATALIRSWNGSSWVADQPSRNPADVFRHVLQGSGNARPRTDSEIDLPSIQAWHAHCATNGFTFDQVRDFTASVPETLRDIAAAGRGALAMIDGKWGIIFEQASAPVVQHFTPRNSSSFEGARGFVEMPHGFRVRFVNAEQGWRQDERIVYADGFNETNATLFEGIDFAGVTAPALAWRHARYHLAQALLRRETFTLQCDFEHLVATRGDRVRVTHDVPMWGLASGRVRFAGASPDRVTLDEQITMEAGRTYTIRFRLSDGDSIVRQVITVAGESDTLLLSGTGSLPVMGDLFMLGEVNFESQVLRVLSIEPQANFTARITLVNDAPEIASADTGAIPPFNTGLAPARDTRLAVPRRLAAIERVVAVNGAARSAVVLTWDAPEFGAPVYYSVEFKRASGADWQSAGSVLPEARSITIPDLDAAAYQFRVRAAFGAGNASNWTQISFDVALPSARPGDVLGFEIANTGESSTLTWRASESAFVEYYEIRFSPLLVGATWSASTPIVPRAQGTTATVPSQVGTYLIKATTALGQQSVNAALIISNTASLRTTNVVETLVQHPAFAGARQNVSVNGSGFLVLTAPESLFGWSDFFGPPDFFLGFDGLSTGTYSFAGAVDLGAAMPSRLSALLDVVGVNLSADVFVPADFFSPSDFFGSDPSSWSVVVEVRTTNDNPAGSPVWSAWSPLQIGVVTARAFQFRAILLTTSRFETPAVRQLSVTVDMPDRLLSAQNIAVPSGGLTVTFNPALRAIKGVVVDIQGSATGDTYSITGKSPTGFSIQCFNAAGTPVARTMDWFANGYGVVQ